MIITDLGTGLTEDFLALEKQLLDEVDQNPDHPGHLHFWESSDISVVLGASNKAEIETNLELCQADNIPIHKRVSGGGTVMQGSGCINYALIIPMHLHADLGSIQSANCFVMRKVRDALQPLTEQTIAIKGHTDLAINDIKFSGNAQRRKKLAMLFHGTVLYDYDLSLIDRYLAMPSKQPDYRNNRPHHAFIQQFPAQKSDILTALKSITMHQAHSCA